ncbi:hypothetical protein IWX50DRAFT_95061 [Phyllosticta citricarpa]
MYTCHVQPMYKMDVSNANEDGRVLEDFRGFLSTTLIGLFLTLFDSHFDTFSFSLLSVQPLSHCTLSSLFHLFLLFSLFYNSVFAILILAPGMAHTA